MNFAKLSSNLDTDEKQKLKLILIAIAGMIFCTAGGAGYQWYQTEQHRAENERLADSLMEVGFNHYYDMHECSDQPFDVMNLVDTQWDESVHATIYPQTLDLSTPGEKQVNILLRFTDDLGEVHRKIYSKKIRTRDTLQPEIDITQDQVELWQYANFNPADYINGVQDIVDGNLELADELGPGKYTISSDVDTKTPGSYTVKIDAEDSSGNQKEKTLEVAVYQKPVQQVSTPTYTNTNYGYSNYYQPSYDYSYASYSSPAYNSVNFGYDVASGNSQAIIDAGGIAYQGGDYFHHNTGDFMNQFWGTQVGDTVTIGGNNYTCTGIGHGYVGDGGYTIYSDDGNEVYLDGNPNLITCDGGPGTDQRWIMYLEEQH